MRWNIAIFLIFLAVPLAHAADQGIGKPGITPDSPLYFADRLLDVFQSVESVANERAAEAIVMAQENNQKGFEKALAGYENAMIKREAAANKTEDAAANLAGQASMHLAALTRAKENASEEAQAGLDKAIEASAQGRARALEALQARNATRATQVAQETLTSLLSTVPEQARPAIQAAIDRMQNRTLPTFPNATRGNGTGRPENATEGRNGSVGNRSEGNRSRAPGNDSDENETEA
jgi:hypothetical protein